MLWIFNFMLVIEYFYVFPLLYAFIRFLRYSVMSLIYLASENFSHIKDSFSPDLYEQLKNFKNYTAPWGLPLIDELKLIMNMLGYTNKFSELVSPDSNNIKNISQNKYVASGLLGMLVLGKNDSNLNNIFIYVGTTFFITITVVSVILGIIGVWPVILMGFSIAFLLVLLIVIVYYYLIYI